MVVLIILLLSLGIRLIGLNQSLWLDEAINVVYARSNDFWWFVSEYPIGDFHPPGYFAILWIWGHIFGFSEISVRAPSVIFGVLTVYLTFLIGRKLFSSKVGLLSSVLLALAPLHIYYSQEARMYSFAAFAATMSTYALINLSRKKLTGFFLYTFSTLVLLSSDYLAYFVLFAQTIWVIFYKRPILKIYFLSLVSSFVLFIPWLIKFVDQLGNGLQTAEITPGWKKVVGGATIKNLILLPVKTLIGRIDFSNNFIYSLVLAIFSAPYLISISKIIKKIEEKTVLLWFWLVIPPLLAFLISFFIPVFSYFRFIFILPGFYLLLAVGLSKIRENLQKILIVLIILFELTASLVYLFNPKYHREDWKGAVELINQKSTPKSLVLLKSNSNLAPFKYYQKQANPLPAFINIPVKSEKDIIDLNKSLSMYEEIYIFDYLVDITDPKRILEKEVKDLNFIETQKYDFNGVGFITLYEKKL